jgi:hypothetical protein
LFAISESPDGSKLAVSDFGGQAIYVLNPDNPASAKSYSMSLDHDGFAASYAPGGLAVTNTGMVYFVTTDINGTGTPYFHKLNTTTSSITDLGQDQSGGGIDFDRVLLSPDGSKVYSSLSGQVDIGFWVDTSNNSISYSSADYLYGGFPDLAVSGDGTTVNIAGELTDSSLNPQVKAAYIDWETWFPFAATGQKLSQDGSILFQPLTDGIDMIARNTGRLLYRIQIPVTLANVYDAVVVAGGQNTLAVISPTAVSFVDLSSLPIAKQFARPFQGAAHPKTGSLAERQTLQPTRRAISNRSLHWPRLRQRLEQSKGHVRIP